MLFLDLLPDDGVVDAQSVEVAPQGLEGPLVALGRAAVLVVSVATRVLNKKQYPVGTGYRFSPLELLNIRRINSDRQLWGG